MSDILKRIGLLTLPLHTNYGGIIQAAALYRVLTAELKKDVVFLERGQKSWRSSLLNRLVMGALRKLPSLPELRSWLANSPDSGLHRILPEGLKHKLLDRANRALGERRARTHQPFIQRYLPQRTGQLDCSQDLTSALQRFGLQALVVGSDQVWRMDYFPSDAEEDYFLGFAPSPEIRKIAYAASFGHSSWKFPRHTARTKELIAQFDAVSVREASGVAICATVFDRTDALHVIDPTLLVDASFYEQIAGSRKPSSQKSFLSYVLDEAPDRQAFSRDVRTALGTQFAHRSLTLDTGSRTVDIPEWLSAFIEADFVLTDSFHGMAFSIIFRKNFLAIINQDRGADRFTSLALQLGLKDRLIDSANANPEVLHELVRQPVDYAAVEHALNRLKAESMDFLRQSVA